MTKHISVIACIPVFFALAACSATSGSDSNGSVSAASSADSSSFCSSYCKRNAACDADVDEQTCTTTCENGSDSIAKLRADLVDAVKSCYDGADCKTVLTKDGLSSCIEQAAVSVAPTSTSRSFCEALSSKMSDCDADFDMAECLDLAKIYSDETLQAATKCTSKSCSNMGPCVDAELDLGN